MVWYFDIILGVMISLAFLFGGILYIWSREEIDVLFGKIKTFKAAKTVLLVSALLLGIIFSLVLKTSWKEIASLLLFIFILVSSSIVYVGDDKGTVVKYAAASMALFFISFLVTYVIKI